MLQDVPLGQAYSQVRHYGGGVGGTPIFSNRFYANLVSGPTGQWGVQPPLNPRGLATELQYCVNSYFFAAFVTT